MIVIESLFHIVAPIRTQFFTETLAHVFDRADKLFSFDWKLMLFIEPYWSIFLVVIYQFHRLHRIPIVEIRCQPWDCSFRSVCNNNRRHSVCADCINKFPKKSIFSIISIVWLSLHLIYMKSRTSALPAMRSLYNVSQKVMKTSKFFRRIFGCSSV